MAPASVKQLLKDAKAALDAKDFSSTLQTCREILKNDKRNYHAFVFVGVATAAQGDLERAVHSYQRAIELRPKLPLAYRGLIDALSSSSETDHRLISARAHVDLARVSPQYSGKSIPAAAELFYALADENPELTSEAVDALKESQQYLDESHKQKDQTVYRTARLLLRTHSIRVTDKSEDLTEALEATPLSAAMDEYAKLLCSSPRSPLEGDVLRFLVKRALLRIQRGEEVRSNLDLLRKTGSYETLLEVAELDQAPVKAQDRILFSMRHVHMYPYEKTPSRAVHIFAAEFFRATEDLDIASRIARLDTTTETKRMMRPTKPSFSSCTEAIVKAFFHLIRQEYKISSMVASEGKIFAASSGGRHRYEAFFDLVKASALRGDRNYKESLSLFNATKVYGQKEGHSWIENASHQGAVKTSVLGYGRRSRQTSTAVEEAAGSPSSMFGLLECLWTDALAGDIDLVRMEEIAKEAEKHTFQAHEAPDHQQWECTMMDSAFVQSAHEIAATSETRLGQSILEETRGTRDGLLAAQRHQMKAASIFKGTADPFAQLGYIFEQLEQMSAREDSEKALARAVRCYEKALSFDSAHPVASRRLTRLLLRKGQIHDASRVAQNASEKNPMSRWAHNVTGWVLLSDRRPIEAAVSFRNALRGRLRHSFKEEEAVFGTDVGRTEDDNSLVVDVDSWRGLCNAYRQMGKLGPAVACLEDALTLARRPPNAYMATKLANFRELQNRLQLIIEAEKGLTILSQRKADKTESAMGSLQNGILNVALSHYSMGDAFMELAVEQWMQGCYNRATQLRAKAGRLVATSLQCLIEGHPKQNASCVMKRLGDIYMEISTNHPSTLSRLVGETFLNDALTKAIRAYSQAFHLSPWESRDRLQDLAAALSRKAQFAHDEELAKCTVHLTARSQLDPGLTAISLLEAGVMTPLQGVKYPATSIAQRISESAHSRRATVELCTILSSFSDEASVAAHPDAAVRVIREDPTDWRGWYATGKVRELDAVEKEWPPEVTKSCEEAFSESDRLGCGPAAVAGRVRCAVSLLGDVSREGAETTSDTYRLACLCASNAARIGLAEPSACTDVINRYREHVMAGAEDLLQHVSVEDKLDLHRTIHIFPFLETATKAIQ